MFAKAHCTEKTQRRCRRSGNAEEAEAQPAEARGGTPTGRSSCSCKLFCQVQGRMQFGPVMSTSKSCEYRDLRHCRCAAMMQRTQRAR